MKNNLKVSIIIPVYNSGKYLETCLNSILAQTYKNLEIIIINDGSTDNSPEIIENYEKDDSRIKVITQKNQGLSASRNNGLKKATGDYVTFVDSDDEIELTMIGDMLEKLKETNSDIAVCSFKEKFSDGKIKNFNKNYPEKILTKKEALSSMLKEEGFMVSTTMKLFPKSYFKNVEFPIGKLHEDVGTTYKLIMKAEKIVFLPNEYYIYNHHEDSIISKKFDNRKLDLITLTDGMCDEIEKTYPDLKNVTNERRMRARFSILRQIPLDNKESKKIINYLKNNKEYITKNPEASKIDKIALKLALINPNLFKLAYKLFK